MDEKLDTIHPAQLKALKLANAVSRDAYNMYDAKAMHGLPVGVQIVGKRLEEEKVLEGMKLVEKALREKGISYKLIDV